MVEIVYEGQRYQVPDDFAVIFNGKRRIVGATPDGKPALVNGTVVDVDLPGNVPAGTPLDLAFPFVVPIFPEAPEPTPAGQAQPGGTVLLVLRGGGMYFVPVDATVKVGGRNVRAGDLESGTVVGSITAGPGVVRVQDTADTEGIAEGSPVRPEENPYSGVIEGGAYGGGQAGSASTTAQPGEIDTTPVGGQSGGGAATPAPGVPAAHDSGIPQTGPLAFDWATATDEQIEAHIRTELGSLAWALDIPELRAIVFKAVRESWTDQAIRAAMQNTEWWRTTEPQQRELARLRAEDPAYIAGVTTDVGLDIRLEAIRMGIQLDDATIARMAGEALDNGWVDLQGNAQGNLLTQAIINESHKRPAAEATGPGSLQVSAEELMRTAEDWMVPIAEQTAMVWAERIALGETDAATFGSYVQDLAASRFPHLAGIISQGISPRAHFDPYRQQAANLLGVNPDEIDLFGDPRFSPMVETWTKEGVRSMTLAEAGQFIRRMPEWQRSPNGLVTAARTAEAFLQAMGETG